jgi:hypothetical protein
VLLGIAVSAIIGYSTYNSRTSKGKSNTAAQSASGIMLMDEIMRRGGMNSKETVIRLYWLLRSELNPRLSTLVTTGQTEREIIANFRSTLTNGAAAETLQKIYSVYEGVRFGNMNVSSQELESYLNDVRTLGTWFR